MKESYPTDFLEQLLKGNRQGCSKIVREILRINPSIKDLYEGVFRTSLYKVGQLWETNQLSVAAEHTATAIVEGILNELFEQLISTKRCNKKVVVACVDKEQHQVGIKMVADVFEMNGWESYFLGTGIPNQELIRYIHEVKPDLIALSLSVYYNFLNFQTLLNLLVNEFPDLQILVGGQALQHISEKNMADYKNVQLLPDLYVLEKYIVSLNSKSKS